MIPKSGNRFSEKIMLNKQIERDDDSKSSRSSRALPRAREPTAFTHVLAESLLLPLVGRTDSAEGRARRGSPGIEHLTDSKSVSRRGRGLTDHVGLAPAADARRAGFDREPYARRPPPCPPPQRGRGIARRLCENPI